MKKFFSTLSSTLYGGVRGGLLFLALLTTSSLWAYDYDFERNEIRYKIISDEVGNRTVEVVGSYTNYATHFTIPKTVIHGAAAYEVIRIGDEAFDNHKTIAVIELPNSITSIGKSAFYNSTLKEITIPNSVTDIEESAFKSCTKLTSATLGNNVMTIGEDAFYNCTGLTSITIPNSVTTIGKYAFSGCSLLTSVTIPESVTNMSANPFSGCSAVTSIVWNAKKCTDPFNVLVFGDICTQITSFTFGDSVQHIPAYMCYGMNNLTSITIPNSVTSIGSSAFRDCTGLTSITIPNSVTSIGSNVFYGCSSLTSITIPNSVTSIGNYAFYNCSGLTSITIPNSVTSIGDYVFSGCSGLISIIVEDTNSTYDSRDNCNAIIKTATNTLIIGCKNTTIPNSVTSIGNNAFYGCSSLTSITIPNSVTSIGSSAFYGCSGLTSITSLAEIPPTLGSSVFYNVSTTIPVYVCAVSAYQSAEGWKAFTNIQELLVEYSIAVGVNDSIMGTAKVDYNTYCKGAQITATANQGYHFVQWSDGNTDNPRALVLTQDTAFTAEFAVSYSGQCGDDLYWAYDEDSKKISITGSGDMYNYTHSTQPWLFFQEQITEVTTSNTTSSIGTSAFEGCVRLGKVSLGYGMENIAAKAFAECKRLYDIYCYASYPPFAEQSSFANYNVYVYIPCEYQRDYTLDVVWGEFKFIECIGAKSDETGGDDIVITPGSTDVTITWPTENNADTYTIVIKKVGEVVCTLTFNADGQLLNIAFAPGREGNHPAQYAEAAANGYRFTVTGLEEATDYTYTITTKDASNKTINTHSGKFTTKSITAVENTHSQSPMTNCQKTIRNGQLIIIRDGVEYDALGQEL